MSSKALPSASPAVANLPCAHAAGLVWAMVSIRRAGRRQPPLFTGAAEVYGSVGRSALAPRRGRQELRLRATGRGSGVAAVCDVFRDVRAVVRVE